MTPSKARRFDESQIEHCRYCDRGKDPRMKCAKDHESNLDYIEQEIECNVKSEIIACCARIKDGFPKKTLTDLILDEMERLNKGEPE